MLINLLVFCMRKFIQNTNRSISILFEFHTKYLFESNLYWVYNNIHVTHIASLDNTRAKRLRMCKVSIFKLAVANANFTIRMPVFELKSNFISIQNFKAGNVKPPGMHWSKDF